MKKMKKMLAAILTGGMVLALAACGSGGGESKEEWNCQEKCSR